MDTKQTSNKDQLSAVVETLEKAIYIEDDDDTQFCSIAPSTQKSDSYYSGSEDDDESEWDSDLEEEMEELEEEIMKNLSRQLARPLHKAASSPAMLILLQQARGNAPPVNPLEEYRNLAARMKPCEGTAIMQSPNYRSAKSATDREKPATMLKAILKDVVSVDYFPPAMWDGFFLEIQPEFIEAHTAELEQRIRKEDFGALRTILSRGGTLQSCNKFGESIVHLAARRGTNELLKFLMEEGKVSVRVRDDCGRSPFHDACWNSRLKFAVVKTLIEDSPELLFVKDYRGFSPFDYIPRSNWEAWCTFLEENREWIIQKVTPLELDEKISMNYKRESFSSCSRRSSF